MIDIKADRDYQQELLNAYIEESKRLYQAKIELYEVSNRYEQLKMELEFGKENGLTPEQIKKILERVCTE